MTKWDCLWIREECEQCGFYHNIVESETEPRCPHGYKPKWRKINDSNSSETLSPSQFSNICVRKKRCVDGGAQNAEVGKG